ARGGARGGWRHRRAVLGCVVSDRVREATAIALGVARANGLDDEPQVAARVGMRDRVLRGEVLLEDPRDGVRLEDESRNEGENVAPVPARARRVAQTGAEREREVAGGKDEPRRPGVEPDAEA